ncbi:MAG: cytochrome c3 family protein [Longimicrobiales bacterium]|nr:cytochrome c3 family protein [Longimicrobiales bacterium]
MMKTKWMMAAAGAGVVASLAFVQAQQGQDEAGAAPAAAAVPAATAQPIQFPHDIHAGTYQMDCQYCHFSAERSVDAGIPPVSTCMGCHNMIPGANQPQEVDKLREYWNNRESIPWVRIHKVADHVHFPHMRHINAGMQCQECHGQIQEIGVLEQPEPEWGKGKMGWCVSCHVVREVSRDCTVCHY